jgi:hypothetical protein
LDPSALDGSETLDGKLLSCIQRDPDLYYSPDVFDENYLIILGVLL